MESPLGRITALAVLVFLFLLTACSIPTPTKTISISGVIDLPLPVAGEKYWIDDGPLFIASRDPLITYRVIDKEELEFAGTDKSVYEFFRSSFSDPDGIVEESFQKSHDSYELREQNTNGMQVLVFSKPGETKAYMVSSSLQIGLEILAAGTTSRSIVDEIINNARLKEGD